MKNLKKTEAINLSVKNGVLVDKNNCTYASRNSNPNAPVYWATPDIVCLKQDWWLILNDWNTQEINVFCIPANKLTVKQISTRSDDPNRLDIRILCGDAAFANTRGTKISFAPYLKKTLPYPSAGKKTNQAVKKTTPTPKNKNTFDLLIDEFGAWLFEEQIVGSKASASSYKSYIKALAREINKSYGANWFQNFSLFYNDDKSNLYNVIGLFITRQKQNAKGDAKKNWNNRQSGFSRFYDFLNLKNSDIDEDELDVSNKENEVIEKAQQKPQPELVKPEPAVTAEIPDSTVIDKFDHKELIRTFKFRMNTQNRWYPKFGGKNGLLFLGKLFEKLFREAKDKRWDKLLENDLNNMRILVGPNENDFRVIKDVIKIEYRKDETFLVTFQDGSFPLYTRQADDSIIILKTAQGMGGTSIDHIIPLENDLREKIDSLPTLVRITDMIADCLDELGMPVKLRGYKEWFNMVYDVISEELKTMRDSLYQELESLDRQYELMDKSQNSKKGKKKTNS